MREFAYARNDHVSLHLGRRSGLVDHHFLDDVNDVPWLGRTLTFGLV